MARNPLTWLRDVLSVGGSGEPTGSESAVERRPARLFECPGCETTYIGVEMEICSRCGDAVRRIPNERDLGGFREADPPESRPPRDP